MLRTMIGTQNKITFLPMPRKSRNDRPRRARMPEPGHFGYVSAPIERALMGTIGRPFP
jgi:hypothetical protein